MGGMRPSREGLDPNELAGGHVHLRLELQRERAFIERAFQLFGPETNDCHRALRLSRAR